MWQRDYSYSYSLTLNLFFNRDRQWRRRLKKSAECPLQILLNVSLFVNQNKTLEQTPPNFPPKN